jgi:hypothetical protein
MGQDRQEHVFDVGALAIGGFEGSRWRFAAHAMGFDTDVDGLLAVILEG